MIELIRFIINIHIPLFILGQLFFVQDLTQDSVFFMLSLNIVFVLTSGTYISILIATKDDSVKYWQAKNRRQKNLIPGLLVGWFMFFYVFKDYIEGVMWASVVYVILMTWFSWFIAVRRKQDIDEKAIHPVGLLSLEVLTVAFAILSAYALYDVGFIAHELWAWLALLFVNILLIWNEFILLLNRKNIISRKAVGNIIVAILFLLSLPIWAVLFRNIGM